MFQKKPYEISIWEDVLFYAIENQGQINFHESLENLGDKYPNGYTIKTQFFKEVKIATIGSSEMQSPIRAFNPDFKREVNGSFSLTFNMAYKYFDDERGLILNNPFTKLLSNERKVKLFFDNEWYDFLIKEINEESSGYIFSYTCKALFINELSKTGNSIELDTELENNIGTVQQLASYVLQDTDWTVSDSSDKLHSYQEDPLYEFTTVQQVEAFKITFGATGALGQKVIIPSGKKIYCFYSSLIDQSEPFQFLYNESGNYEFDDDYIITNSDNFITKLDIFTKTSSGLIQPIFASNLNFSIFKGRRIVRKQKTQLIPKLQRLAKIYTSNSGEEIYCIEEPDYIVTDTCQNFLTNNVNFQSYDCWVGTMTPSITYKKERSILKLDFSQNAMIINNSLSSTLLTKENGLVKGESYYIGYRADHQLKFKIVVFNPSTYAVTKTLIDFSNSLSDQIHLRVKQEEDNYSRFGLKATVQTSVTQTQLQNYIKSSSIGLLIEKSAYASVELEEILFFKNLDQIITLSDGKTEILQPDTPVSALIKTKYYFFDLAINKNKESLDDLELIKDASFELAAPTGYSPAYDDECEKIKTITVSESNRFNIIQDLCELFECWATFKIEHNSDGSLVLDTETYRPKKSIVFKEYVGKDNYSGFKYGINLKNISRTIKSDEIVTKLLVKDNVNEFGMDGFCSIARASENPLKSNFILNFEYYINQKLIDREKLYADLYGISEETGAMCYSTKMFGAMDQYKTLVDEIAASKINVSKLEAKYELYQDLKKSLSIEISEQKKYFNDTYGYSTFPTKEPTQVDSKQSYQVIKSQETRLNETSVYLSQIDVALRTERAILERKEKTKEEIIKLTKSLNTSFDKKYFQFVQEGTWISEDYYDDNLYYFDSLSTLHTSSQPQITYQIDVVDVSQIPDFENYTFNLGDKTFIEDPEFFGWIKENGNYRPRQEEVIISAIYQNLDAPERNQIIIQNFKTQFEDLFQRITATTTSIEYSTGKYEKASSILDTQGNIKPAVLQNALINNTFTINNSKNESVKTDEHGITAINLQDPSKQIRIISGGVFITRDGGLNWVTGITGNGINANAITAGRVDTSIVTIGDSSFPSFRWDKSGISAYEVQNYNENENEVIKYNFSKYIKFDQYGLYGINGIDDFSPQSEKDVINNSTFSLTWSGFHLKTTDNGASGIEITSSNDFAVFGKQNPDQVTAPELVKIGRLNFDEQGRASNVGIRISNNEGPVLETNDDGTLWLKNRLNISSSESKNQIAIGFLGIREGEERSRIFEAGPIDKEPNFILWEDGSLQATNGHFKGHVEATSGSFKGHIEATSGKIGNVEIQTIQDLGYRVVVTSDKGFLVDDLDNQEVTLTATVYNGSIEYTPEQGKHLTYQWFNSDNTPIEGASRKNFTFSLEDDRYQFYVIVEEQEDEEN